MSCPPRAWGCGELGLSTGGTENRKGRQEDQTPGGSPCYRDPRNSAQAHRERTGVEMASEAQRWDGGGGGRYSVQHFGGFSTMAGFKILNAHYPLQKHVGCLATQRHFLRGLI